jgi:hypothetical protein
MSSTEDLHPTGTDGTDQRSGPVDAVIMRAADGTRTVIEADQTILVSVALLHSQHLDPGVIEPDGTLRLDTAGHYRYRFVRAVDEHIHVYERIASEVSQ